MVSVVLAASLLHQKPNSLSDQVWKLQFTTIGDITGPVGGVKDFKLAAEISISKLKETKANEDAYRFCLTFDTRQAKILDTLTSGLATHKQDASITADAYRDGDIATFVNIFAIDRERFFLKPRPETDTSDLGNFQSSALLYPLSLTLGITQLALNAPQLRKEYFLGQDGPRKYFVTFTPNLNANTDERKGEAAYKFRLKQSELHGVAPNLFTGAIRLNTKTGKVQYINAQSSPENWIGDPSESFLGGIQNVAIRIDPKE